MARRPLPYVGFERLGRPIAFRADAARRGVSLELAFIPGAAEARVDSPGGSALVFRDDPVPGRSNLFCAMPRPGAIADRIDRRCVYFRAGRLCWTYGLATDAQRRGVGAPGHPLYTASGAGRAPAAERAVLRILLRCLVAVGTPPDPHLPVAGRRRNMALVVFSRRTMGLECRASGGIVDGSGGARQRFSNHPRRRVWSARRAMERDRAAAAFRRSHTVFRAPQERIETDIALWHLHSG